MVHPKANYGALIGRCIAIAVNYDGGMRFFANSLSVRLGRLQPFSLNAKISLHLPGTPPARLVLGRHSPTGCAAPWK